MELHERIVKARKDAGLTQERFALAVGKSRAAVTQWESGEIRPRQKTIEKIAEVTKKPMIWLEAGVGEGGGGLMVIGKVAAGIWKEGTVNFAAYDAPYSPRSDFPAAAQRLWDVEGTSINKLATEGDWLLGLDIMASGISPENGDYVVARRSEHGMAEYTVKKLVIEGRRKILRPDSTDPQWQTDIEINGDDSTEIDLIDIIIGVERPVRRRRGF